MYTICGTPVQAIWDHLSWPSWQGGSGKVKICPGMALIWLWSRPEAPKGVNDPWNGSQMVSPTAPDWFESPSWPFEALQPLCIKKYQISYIVKIIDFWNFNFTHFSWPTESLFERFRNFPHPTTCWWGVENYKTFQKVPQLAMKLAKVTCIFFTEFWVKNFESFWNFQKSFWWPKKPWNHPYFISPIDETTEKHVFLPQKGPYLPNRPNQKRAWDSVTRRVWVYREKFNIDFWFQNFFLTSQHILGLPKKIWAKNPMLNFSGWPRKLGSPFNWDSQKWSKMRHIVKFCPRGTP